MKKQQYEVVYVSDDGAETTAQINAISRKSLKEILSKRSIKPVRIRCTTSFDALSVCLLRSVACITFTTLAIIMCGMQLLAYYGQSLATYNYSPYRSSSSTPMIIVESIAGAFGASVLLLLALFLSLTGLFIARNTSHKYPIAKWCAFVLLWWAGNLIFEMIRSLNT